MLIVLCGTNRPEAYTRRVARRTHRLCVEKLGDHARLRPVLLDLARLPREVFEPGSYARQPEAFGERFQAPIDDARAMIVVTPEYNGSFPGVLKLFVDMLAFPRSLLHLPVAFIGLSEGPWGALRSIEQLTHIFQYRKAHVFGDRLFIPRVSSTVDEDGRTGPHEARLELLVDGFIRFAEGLGDQRAASSG
jgi:NAD(P)H-dependent FMN reductase